MKKSIAFVLPNLNAGGAQRVISSLANLLIKEYHVLIVVHYKCEPFYKLNSNIKINYCQLQYNTNTNKLHSLTNNYRLVKNLTRILKEHKTDIAIAFLPATNIYTILASKFAKIPCIISERANPELFHINAFWHTVRKLAYPFSSRLVVQTIGTKNYFKKYSKSEIEIIKNPLNSDLLNKRDVLIPKENIILNVGRLIEIKNQDLLIRAFSNIKHGNWKLILVGDGDRYESYKKLISSLKMEEHIILAGNISDVSEYYNKAKIFAFTSKHEGFPNVITEAMSFGLACISTDCPFGPSELIKNNENGFLIPVGDQKALEIGLTELINNPELRNAFSEKSSLSLQANNPNEIASQWSTLINKLIEKQ
ncbi:glycosyltransferase family 4 protein [Bizionia arctica]|uniref:Glycosyl transferase n=1 Tax=Bizionia arctica TaxID=1495645 RepID=A0A917LP93_9FLAO|nr:glycosyltransferase family 4 protein [Bizionia arctica]GGG48424.1 glycosyl transferase [Bizionia arctica]